MKKVVKIMIAIILAFAVIGGITFLIDRSRAQSGQEPIFAQCVASYGSSTFDHVTLLSQLSEGTNYYFGLGYKVIYFDVGGPKAKFSSWFTSFNRLDNEIYEEYKEYVEPKRPDSGTEIPSGEQAKNSGDISVEPILSGDALMNNSGDKDENLSGDNKIETTSGDVKKENNDEKGDITVNSGDGFESGEQIEDTKPSFLACIVGLKNETMIVTPLEDEEINKSADMISFSIKDITDEQKQNYIIGQKVKITYTGYIRESYPAQIDAVSIEIINE